MGPFRLADDIDYLVTLNNWIQTGNTRSTCYRIRDRGFQVKFSDDQVLHGSYAFDITDHKHILEQSVHSKTRALKCKTLGGIHMQVSHSTAATHIHYTSVVCIYCACACECLAAPSRPSPVSRLFHAVCTSS